MPVERCSGACAGRTVLVEVAQPRWSPGSSATVTWCSATVAGSCLVAV
jgi:hypothetical protein